MNKNRPSVSQRVGIDLPSFKGMNRNADAAAIGEEEFWYLENVRLTGGSAIQARPGLADVGMDAMAGCIIGVFDDRNPSVEIGLLWT